jgi:hypothetical protein
MTTDSIKHYSTLDNRGIQDGILFISENLSWASELCLQMAEKGYKTFNIAPVDCIRCLETEHPALIILLNCPEACLSIIEHLHLHSGISDTTIICMSDRIHSGIPSVVEQIVIEKFPPHSAAFDALESRIQFFLHQRTSDSHPIPEATLEDRRRHERRNSVNLAEQSQITHQEPVITTSDLRDSPCAEENHDLITLSLVSQCGHLFDLLQTYFSDTRTINLCKNCINSQELIPCSLEQASPDIILVDSALSNPAVSEWLIAIREQNQKIKIILLYENETPDMINEIVDFGISGLVKTDAGSDLFKKAVWTVQTRKAMVWTPPTYRHQSGRLIELNYQTN